MPRYYITVTRSAAGLAAVVHASADGRVTGTVKVPSLTDAAAWSVTAAGDDRSFVIAADLSQTAIAGTADSASSACWSPRPASRRRRPSCRRFPLMRRCSRAWRCPRRHPARPVPRVRRAHGRLQALRRRRGHQPRAAAPDVAGPGDATYSPGAPSWAGGDRMITFTWWRRPSRRPRGRDRRGPELDAAAPGGNLLASRSIPFRAVTPGIGSALISSRGREIVAAACHTPPLPAISRAASRPRSSSCRPPTDGCSACSGRRPPAIPASAARTASTAAAPCCRSTPRETACWSRVRVRPDRPGRLHRPAGRHAGVTLVAAAWLFAGGAVDLLAEEVGVAEMPAYSSIMCR